MDVGVYAYTAGDPVLIDKIVNEFLSQGKFDKLRKECMADADTKPAYQNLQQRVESTVTQFLKKQVWKPDINKNQLRDSLRKHISESGFLDAGINRIVDQIVNPNVLATVFMPEVEEVVYSYLSIPRPGDKSNKHCDNAKTYSNYKVKHQSTDELKGKLDIDRDFKKSQKNEENQTNNFYERFKSEDFEDKTNGQKCENISSAESVADLQTETTRDTQSEIKAESEETEEMKECKSEMVQEEGNESNGKFFPEKMEVPSDDSQESLSRMGVERLRISDSDGVNAADSDASLPLEINEKSMSDSRDSDDSIMNKMSPISQGRLSPEEGCAEEEKETKEGKEGKKPLTFVGRIPKIKRDDSEAKKAEEVPKRSEGKSVYSSDESDSSKHSSGKSDAEEKKKTATAEEERPEVPKEKSDRKYKEEDRKRKSDHHRSSDGRSRSRDEKRDKSRSRREEKDKGHSRSRDERSRDKNSSGDKKSSSSSSHSRSRSSSHHKSGGRKSGSHEKEHHRDDSRSREKDRSRHDRKERDKRDFDRRKREEEKRKKSKSVDDHGKERNRRDDRRSTDRDSNERERDKTKEAGSGVVQSDGKRGREKDQKDETKRERNQKEESDSRNERDGESAQTVKTEGEREGGSAAEDVAPSESDRAAGAAGGEPSGAAEPEMLDLRALFERGALTKVRFPKVVDDFYVKFDSTGFRYFEDWETTKLDCEEEFKEYIDEAERDLALLSDDGSDYEPCDKHARTEATKRTIIEDSLRGVGNFHGSLMFDPVRYEFYAWKDESEYRSRRGREARDVGSGDGDRTREVDEEDMQCQADKNKENRDRGRRIRKSLKFLNRYHRKIGLTLKRGREQHRFVSRPRKAFPFGRGEIRERNAKPMDELKENQPEDVGQDGSSPREDGDKSGEESVASTVPKMDVDAKIRLYQIQSMRRSKPESCQAKILARLTSGSKVGADAENGNENVMVEGRVVEVDGMTRKVKKKGIRIGLPRPRPRTDLDVDVSRKLSQNFSLPLSPESDDSMFNSNGVISQRDAAKAMRKRPGDGYAELPAKKDCKRTLNQKYESQDLYKPRPFSIGSKSRGRALRAEENTLGEIDDGDK